MTIRFSRSRALAMVPLLAWSAASLEAGNQPSGQRRLKTAGMVALLASAKLGAEARIPLRATDQPFLQATPVPTDLRRSPAETLYALEALLAAKGAGVLTVPRPLAAAGDAPSALADPEPAPAALPAELEALLASARQAYPGLDCRGKTWQGPWEYPPVCRAAQTEAMLGRDGAKAKAGLPDPATEAGLMDTVAGALAVLDAADRQASDLEGCICRTLEAHTPAQGSGWEADLLADLKGLRPMGRAMEARVKALRKVTRELAGRKRKPARFDSETELRERLAESSEPVAAAVKLGCLEEAIGKLEAALEKHDERIEPLLDGLKEEVARQRPPKEEEHIQSTWTPRSAATRR